MHALNARVLEQLPKSMHAPDVHCSVFITASTPILLQAKCQVTPFPSKRFIVAVKSQVTHNSLLQTMSDHAVNCSTECARLVSETCNCQSLRRRSG
eukprot:4450888-Pleurochrysis_carterae.AAC.1